MATDRRVQDLIDHLNRGKKICDPVYEPMPLMMDSPPKAVTVGGTLVITNERKAPNGEPVITKAACFGKPDDARGIPGNVAVIRKL